MNETELKCKVFIKVFKIQIKVYMKTVPKDNKSLFRNIETHTQVNLMSTVFIAWFLELKL